MNISQSVRHRFAAKYIPVTESGCWLWTASIRNGTGYGQMHFLNNKPEFAHRISWMLHHEKHIPDRMFVLHKCNVRCCVNPDHLYIGTQQQNVDDMARSGSAYFLKQSAFTHCKNGHEFAGDNLYITSTGNRCCRACQKVHMANYKARQSKLHLEASE